MLKKSFPLCALTVLSLLLGLTWGGDAAAQTINPGAVTLNQIDFRVGADSVVGEITIDYAAAGSPGFVNVIDAANPTPTGWLVQNLPVFPPGSGYGSGSITTRLDLTPFAGMDGVNVSAVNLIIDFNPAPSVTVSAVLAHGASAATYAVGAVDNAVGSTDPGGLIIGYEAAPNLGGVNFVLAGPLFFVLQGNHPNVQAAHNQCAPAAVANSLQFLANTTPLVLPHPNIPGWGGNIPNNTLVGQLDFFMKRQLGLNRCDATRNGGAWPMMGKLAYIGANALPVQVKHRVGGSANNAGVPLNGGANYTFAGVTSIGAGATFDINWIIGELRNGADVELDLFYRRGGRHYVEVVGAGFILGQPFLLHVSDKAQCSFWAGRWNIDPLDILGTNDVDFEWIDNPTAFAYNSNAWIDQIISQTYGKVVTKPTM